MIIAETFDGMPVFFDPNTSLYNSRPPGTVITGEPGSGKTFFSSILAMNAAISGKQVVVFDPKGDFLSLAYMKDELDDLLVWDLSQDQQAGILDPFYMVEDPSEQLTLVTSILSFFLGGIKDNEQTILNPLIMDVIESRNPSLQKIVRELEKDPNSEEARNLGTRLKAIQQMPYAKLCFAPSSKNRKIRNLSKNLSIITLLGLPIPTTEKQAEEPRGRLASGILYLVTYLISKLLQEKVTENSPPQMLLVDEAWSILSNNYGADLIKSIALMGRSLGFSLILATQNNSHIKKSDIENAISTRFAFRCSPKEAASLVEDMSLPENEGFEGVFSSLEQGQCIMQDFEGRYAGISILSWRKDWEEKLTTNPKEIAERERKKIEKEED